jgi:phenylacetate-CoA ligase
MLTTHIILKGTDQFEQLAYRNYALFCWTLTHLPTSNIINTLGASMAWRAFEQARRHVPAYRHFLSAQHFVEDRSGSLDAQFSLIPPTDKNNYVRAFSTAERCVAGRIPARNVIVDESSGSTGQPYNWVRSQAEVEHTRRMCSYFHRYYFGEGPLFIINAYSMGAWATGATVGAALRPNGIVKSTGPDVDKILSTLRFFGPTYRYLITGYPPFLKHLIDSADAQEFDWTGYRMVATVGGEGMSENLRQYLLTRFEKVFSGYGASDLEIGIAGESDLSIGIRQLMARHPTVRQALIGDDHRVPMLFQYNPLDHYIETNADDELLITINRPLLSPRVRYNIRDEGGTLTFEEMVARLRAAGIDSTAMLPKGAMAPRLPFVYVFGRRDSTISYMGANIYPEDVEAGLLANHEYAGKVGAFCMELVEEASTSELRPCVHVEVRDGQPSDELARALQRTLRAKLSEINADFRQAVHEDPSAGELKVELHLPGQGPFAQMHGRIKHRYVLEHAGQQGGTR